jgi:molybdate transport system ATP-binding protein
VSVIDAGRIVQSGTAAELAAAPASAFVADFTGTNVLAGVARPGPGGVTLVDLDGGGALTSLDRRDGPVAVTVHPWEVALARPEAVPAGSARNHLAAEVLSVTAVGNRVRVGLATPQRLAAEVTDAAVRDLGLARGVRVVASFKAAATRLVPR